MSTRRLLPWLLLSAVLPSCYPRADEIMAPYPFENAPTKHRLNLARLLDDELLLASTGDTLRVHVRFEPEQRTSLLLNAATGDTLLRGWVTRFRGHFYVTEPLPNGTYWLYAWRREGKEIRGLLNGPAQMVALTRAVDRGRFAGLTRLHAADSSIRLHYDAQQLRPFYEALVDSFPAYRRLTLLSRAAAPKSAMEPEPAKTAAADTTAAAPLIRSVYPNPAHDQVNLQLSRATPATLELLDAQGRGVRISRPAAAELLTLSLAGVPAGRYLLRLRDEVSRATVTRRLVVE